MQCKNTCHFKSITHTDRLKDTRLLAGTLAALSGLLTCASSAPAPAASDADLSVQDKVILHLQGNDQIAWRPAGKGAYTDIPHDVLLQALDAVGESKPTTNLVARKKAPNDGAILGFAVTKAACYHRGSISQDNVVTQWAVDACDGLIGATLPPLAVNSLRIWQSAQAADLAGQASYIRFGIKLLKDTTINSPSLCQAAFEAFENYCQDGNAETKGGELDVGDMIRFSVDPNEVLKND